VAKVFEQVQLADMATVAKAILQLFPNTKVFLLKGNLGAGKTTLTQHFCKELHSTDTVSSPTYAIANQYATNSSAYIFHIDLYRLKTEEEVLDAGIEEMLFSPHYCFIEWYEVAQALLPENCVQIEIEKQDTDTRKITVQHFQH